MTDKFTGGGLDSLTKAAWEEGYKAGAAAEREECAKVCEERGRANRYGAVVRLKIKECVDAIRARGEQK